MATREGRRFDLGAVGAALSYLLLGFWVMRELWASPAGRVLAGNRGDHTFFFFVMSNGERIVYHGASLLHSDQLNAPVGVNMMANTSVLALSIPMAPVTHVFGPAVTVVLLLSLGLAGTALAWYWFLRRRMQLSRTAAWIGGFWGGFAPGWLSHANSHVNFVCGFVLPFILDQVLRLREPGRVWRGGITLGLLIVLQVFITEETLLLMAIALGFFAIAYALMAPRTVREYAARFVAGGAVAAGVALIVLAYPLYYQFFGPGHYRGQPFVLDRFATSLGSVVHLPRESMFGSPTVAAKYSTSATEDSVFWGPGGCVMILVSIAVLWRSAAARAAAISGFILLVLSFGSRFRTDARIGGMHSPLAWTMHVPLLDEVTTPRYALAPTAIVGILLAWAADRAFRRARWRTDPAGTGESALARAGAVADRVLSPRVLFAAGLLLALVPLFPRPAPTEPARPLPAFFSQGMWRPYLAGHEERSIVTVPLPSRDSGRQSMRIAGLTHSAFRVPEGYFMGPKNPPRNNLAAWSPPPRFTSNFIDRVVFKAQEPAVTPQDRAQIADDLRYWKAAIVVLLPDSPHRATAQSVLTEVLGQPSAMGGVVLWDTRQLLSTTGAPGGSD